MIRIAAPASPAPSGWHRKFLVMLPAILTHARVAFRYLKPEARAEAVAECVANAMVAFTRLHALGKVDLAYPTVPARYAVAQINDGRKVGGRLDIHDVSSAYCQRWKHVVMERLDHFDEEENAWREILVEDRRAGPAEVAATRVDFAEWLQSLPKRLREIATVLASGETTTATARRFKVTPGRISQIRKLLHHAWRQFAGEAPDAGNGAPAPA
jgi:hypothetical protein